ncbi:MAG: glycogen synthase GlgA [Bryobacterales bacterium]|nr:glycogen synthase GlgA [Bryobacterales bacterium]
MTALTAHGVFASLQHRQCNTKQLPKVLMLGSEAAPYAKSGGLADVLGALPVALAQRGVETAVLLPRYASIPRDRLRRVYENFPIALGSDVYRGEIYLQEQRGVRFLFLDIPALYDRRGIYFEDGQDYPDNFLRFAALNVAGCEAIRRLFRADILHCHDWQAGLAPYYLRKRYGVDPTFTQVKSVFTAHNLAFQGIFGREILPRIGLKDTAFTSGELEFYGKISYLKTGIAFADAVTTVSPTYAKEIQTPAAGWGLDGLLRGRSEQLHGILNGADYAVWNPATDPFIAAPYDATKPEGKTACREDLLRTVGLDPEALKNTPVIGIVARLSSQKGFDLIAPVADEFMAENLALVVLGSGEARYEELFRSLAGRYPGRAAFRAGYDESLSHKIEAGADLYLMPSQYEPCGLNQIYSLRYGTVPIVRAVGGLEDSVTGETGFKFAGYNSGEMLMAVREAVKAFENKRTWKKRMVAGMKQDFSWAASADHMLELYQSLIANP